MRSSRPPPGRPPRGFIEFSCVSTPRIRSSPPSQFDPDNIPPHVERKQSLAHARLMDASAFTLPPNMVSFLNLIAALLHSLLVLRHIGSLKALSSRTLMAGIDTSIAIPSYIHCPTSSPRPPDIFKPENADLGATLTTIRSPFGGSSNNIVFFYRESLDFDFSCDPPKRFFCVR